MLPFTIKVKKIKGKGRGKALGIPTLNFSIPQELNLPFGVYAGRLKTNKQFYPAALHFGPRPVFSEKDISLEAYILNIFDEELKDAELEFVKFIREIKNFADQKQMVERIKEDVKEIKNVLRNYEGELGESLT